MQLPSNMVVDPFGEVNVFLEQDGSVRVRATILMKPAVEGAQTGLAIDGSRSMQQAFGGGGAVSAVFASPFPNIVEPVARTLAAYLANFDSDGRTTVIYWACGVAGLDIEEHGDMTAEESANHLFAAPKTYGTGTKLLPAVRYFTEAKFGDAPWSIFVFVTDGVVEDLEDVKAYSLELAQQIAAGQRRFVKLVLLGAGKEVDVGQMEELDDLDYGGLKDLSGDPIDLWDYKLVSEIQKLEEIFAEVVSANTLLAPSAQVVDDNGNAAVPCDRASYADGLPALLEFRLPGAATSFCMILSDGTKIEQPLAQ